MRSWSRLLVRDLLSRGKLPKWHNLGFCRKNNLTYYLRKFFTFYQQKNEKEMSSCSSLINCIMVWSNVSMYNCMMGCCPNEIPMVEWQIQHQAPVVQRVGSTNTQTSPIKINWVLWWMMIHPPFEELGPDHESICHIVSLQNSCYRGPYVGYYIRVICLYWNSCYWSETFIKLTTFQHKGSKEMVTFFYFFSAQSQVEKVSVILSLFFFFTCPSSSDLRLVSCMTGTIMLNYTMFTPIRNAFVTILKSNAQY